MRLTHPGITTEISAGSLRGSYQVAVAPNFPITTSVFEIDAGMVAASTGWTAFVGHAQYAMRETPDATAAHSYDLSLAIDGLDPGETFYARVGAAAGLPKVIARVEATTTVVFDAPWDRYSIERARPQPRDVVLDSFEVSWGALRLVATGHLIISPDGTPEGRIDAQATNWREMVAIARATGALDEAYVGAVTGGLQLLASLAGDPETLDVPLDFRRGRTFLGRVSIGPAPVIHLP